MTKGTIIASALILGALAALILVIPKLQIGDGSRVAGSVTSGNEYMATTTKTFGGTSLTSRALKVGPGTLGSVIITGATAGSLEFFDATTTPLTGVPMIASLPNSLVAGTYTFDVAVSTGLYVLINGTVPTSTITFR